MSLVWSLIKDCDCKLMGFPVEQIDDLEKAVMKGGRYVIERKLYWSIHVKDEHLLVTLEREKV